MANLINNGNFDNGLTDWSVDADGTLVLDNADGSLAPPCAVVTHVSSAVGWCGIWNNWNDYQPDTTYRAKLKVKAPAGTELYVWSGWYRDKTTDGLIGFYVYPFTCDGTWQEITTGWYTTHPDTVVGDFGVYFKDVPAAAYAASVGVSFRLDDVEVRSLYDQPGGLPVGESPMVDMEQAFIDLEPPGLFPENQDSYWGQFRRILAEWLQTNALDLYDRWYDNLDPRTVYPEDLPEYEYLKGLPLGTNLSDQQRRTNILNRMYRGPFTRTQRAKIVESYIASTFGEAASFGADGITLDPGGVSLYSGATSLAGSYAIRENDPSKNFVPNSSFETDVSGWSHSANITLARSTSHAKYGAASMAVSTSSAATDEYFFTPNLFLLPGTDYAWLAWVLCTADTYLRLSGCYLQESGGSQRVLAAAGGSSVFLPANTWTRITGAATLPSDWYAATQIVLRPPVVSGGATWDTAKTLYYDGVQVEKGAIATDWSDPSGPPFFYEVRLLDTIGVDTDGLTRALKWFTPSGISFAITSTPTP